MRDEESRNVIDAIGRGALAGGRIAVTVGALLIAFVALIAMANGILGWVGGWFGADDLTFEQLLGWVLAPLAWLLGVPWSEAVEAGIVDRQKTVLNEFVAFADFGPQVDALSPVTVAVVTFALAGFANFASIAIQIGTHRHAGAGATRLGGRARPARAARRWAGQPRQRRHRRGGGRPLAAWRHTVATCSAPE